MESTPYRYHTWLLPLLVMGLTSWVVWSYQHLQERELNSHHRLYALKASEGVRGTIQQHIDTGTHTLLSLAARVRLDPELSDEDFHTFMQSITPDHTVLRNTALIPDLVIRAVYPTSGNESAIGLDLAQHPQQGAAALAARDSGSMIFSGPVDLVQGGQGVVIRIPVFIDGEDGEQHFWGLVSGVIDFDHLIEHSGLEHDNMQLRFALRGRDGMGAEGEPFYGDAELFDGEAALLTEIPLPNGSWQLAVDYLPAMEDAAGQWLGHLIGALLVILATLSTLIATNTLAERRAREQRYREEKNFSDALFDTVGAVVCVLNRHGRIVRFNHEAERVTGYRLEQLLGEPIWDYLIPDEQVEGVKQVFGNLVAGNFPNRHTNHWKTRDQGLCLIAWSNTALLDSQGEVEYVVATGVDITEQNRIEREREQIQLQLQQAQKMEAIGQLTGGIAHDFNNIIAVILGYTELALQGYAPEGSGKLSDYLKEVHTAAQRARNLVAQMLMFSRGESGQAQPLMLPPMLHEIVTMVRPTIPASIELRVETPEHLPEVMADPTQLNQVLLNLAINARDALDGKGHITFSAAAVEASGVCQSCHESFHRQFVQISVSDDAGGIPADILDKIFDPFFTTKQVGKGTGMGLSMVHGIIHSWGGHIRVETHAGEGTSFHILLPCEVTGEEAAQLEQISAPELPPPASKNRSNEEKIMVVDDEPAVAEFVHEYLAIKGFNSEVFLNPEEALSAFKSEPQRYHLLLTDQTMPHLTGIELAQAVRELRSELPVIIMSGYSEQIDKGSVDTLDIDAFLPKPLDSAALIEQIERLLAASREGE